MYKSHKDDMTMMKTNRNTGQIKAELSMKLILQHTLIKLTAAELHHNVAVQQ